MDKQLKQLKETWEKLEEAIPPMNAAGVMAANMAAANGGRKMPAMPATGTPSLDSSNKSWKDVKADIEAQGGEVPSPVYTVCGECGKIYDKEPTESDLCGMQMGKVPCNANPQMLQKTKSLKQAMRWGDFASNNAR